MARRSGFRTREMGERVALLDVDTGQVHLLDRVATALWRCADGGMTTDGLVQAALDELDGTVEEWVVEHALEDLVVAGLIADDPARPAVRRRTLLAAAALAPAVMTVGASAAAARKPDQGTADVALCHRGRTIRVSPDAVADHLAHGDTLGACGSTTTTAAPPPSTTTTLAPPPPTTTMAPPPPTTTMAPPPPTTTTTLAPPPPTTTMAPPPPTTTLAPLP